MALVEIKFRSWTGKASLNIEVGDDVEPKFRLRAALEIATKESLIGKRPRADLTGAVLRRADLTDAVLRGADLRGAVLTDAVLTGGMRFSEYLSDVVPSLLTAGGKTLEQVRDSGCWNCHTWENCPMHVAFDISDTSELKGPRAIYRTQASDFVRLFDARAIPEPDWNALIAARDETAA